MSLLAAVRSGHSLVFFQHSLKHVLISASHFFFVTIFVVIVVVHFVVVGFVVMDSEYFNVFIQYFFLCCVYPHASKSL